MKKFNPADFSMALSRKLNVPLHIGGTSKHMVAQGTVDFMLDISVCLSTYQHFVDWKLESASVANTYARRATVVLGSMLNTRKSHLS